MHVLLAHQQIDPGDGQHDGEQHDGGGGMNKVNLPNGRLERLHNPKFPEQYIEMLPSVLKQKEELFALMGAAR